MIGTQPVIQTCWPVHRPLGTADQIDSRRMNIGGFVWPRQGSPDTSPITLTREQFDALVLGLPWQRLEQMRLITRL